MVHSFIPLTPHIADHANTSAISYWEITDSGSVTSFIIEFTDIADKQTTCILWI